MSTVEHQHQEESGSTSYGERCTNCTTRLLAKHPIKFLSTTLAFLLIIVLGGAVTNSYTLSDYSIYDWVISDGRASENYEALLLAEGQARGDAANSSQTSEQSSATMWYTFSSNKDESIFTAENVQKICRAEMTYLSISSYPNYCLLNSTTSGCAVPTGTVTYLFYGYSLNNTCPLLDEGYVNATAHGLYTSLNTLAGRLKLGFFMEKDTMSRHPYYTTRTRSRIPLGSPLEGYDSDTDRIVEQNTKYRQFYQKVKDGLFSRFNMKSRYLYSAYRNKITEGDLEFKWFSLPLGNIEMGDIVSEDLTLAMFSLLFVFCWMCYHLESVSLGVMGMTQIVLSLPVSFFIYRQIYVIPYFTELHSLTIFIVLGIGADDVFVFVDGWRQAEGIVQAKGIYPGNPLYLEKRMKIAYSRAKQAVFDTSFTTMVAFFATAISPIMPVSTFGILAATAILVNYLMVITLTPAAVAVYHVYIRNICKRSSSENVEPSGMHEVVTSSPAVGVGTESKGAPPHLASSVVMGGNSKDVVHSKNASSLGQFSAAGASSRISSPAKKLTRKATLAFVISEEQEKPTTAIEAFFHKRYIPAMKWKCRGIFVLPLVMLVVFLVYGVTSMVYATKLSSPLEEEQWFPTNHMFTTIQEDLNNKYMVGSLEEYVKIGMPFGISGIDRPGFNKYKPDDNRGHPVFDAAFDLYLEESQQAFARACSLISTKQCDRNGCERDTLVWPTNEALLCFLPDFQAWFATRNPGYSTVNCTRDTFYSELKVYRQTSTSQLYTVPVKKKLIGFIDGDLKYAAIQFTTTMHDDVATAEKGKVREVVDDLVNEINRGNPPGMENAFGSAGTFVWFETERGLVRGFYMGMIICFPMAFLMLMLSTSNVIVSMLAVISIGLIVSCVLGMCKMFLGWALGTGEAIAGIIVIGFSVDYVIHLGHMYVDANRAKGFIHRIDRFTYSARKMAGTVFAGAITTFGSGLPLFACQLTFFTKMGTLISGTIAFSICYSLGFFMSACLLFGPNGRVGDLIWIADIIGLSACMKNICGVDLSRVDPHKPEGLVSPHTKVRPAIVVSPVQPSSSSASDEKDTKVNNAL
mmetsp:Transcript_8639/g.13996  ORF Transcript_8639/g.13996 Transcript_8639/m.13996 type:complete len:1085 (-) Transcript_8639:259-3513(-)